jgi:hypothetical protein
MENKFESGMQGPGIGKKEEKDLEYEKVTDELFMILAPLRNNIEESQVKELIASKLPNLKNVEVSIKPATESYQGGIDVKIGVVVVIRFAMSENGSIREYECELRDPKLKNIYPFSSN